MRPNRLRIHIWISFYHIICFIKNFLCLQYLLARVRYIKFRKPSREIEVHKIEMRLDKAFGSIILALTKLIGLRHLIQPDKLYVGTFNPKSEDMGWNKLSGSIMDNGYVIKAENQISGQWLAFWAGL